MPRITLFSVWANVVRRVCFGLGAFALLSLRALAEEPDTFEITHVDLNWPLTESTQGISFRRPVRWLVEGATATTTIHYGVGPAGIYYGLAIPAAGYVWPNIQVGVGGWTGLTNDPAVKVDVQTEERPTVYRWKKPEDSSSVTRGLVSMGCTALPVGKVQFLQTAPASTRNVPVTLELKVYFNLSTASIRIEDPYVPFPPPGSNLEPLFGLDLVIPFYGSPGLNKFKLGGVDHDVYGDASGNGFLRFTVPEGWDGSAQFNGVDVCLASGLGHEGGGPMVTGQLIGNLYSQDLPAGMTRWNPAGPLVLPPGMEVGSKIPLPSGMTVAPSGAVAGEIFRSSPTTNGVTRNYSYDLSQVAPLSPGSPVGSQAGAGVATPGGAAATDGEAIAGAKVGFDADKNPFAGPPRGSLTSGAEIRERLKTLFTRQNPLGVPGGLPRINSYALNLEFGKFCTIQKTLRFDESPWTIIRATILVCFTFALGVAYLRKLTI